MANAVLVNRVILIVGGGKDSRAELEAIFRGFGCKSLVADNRAAALAIMENHAEIDIVLLNIATPITTSIEFIREIRNLMGGRPALYLLADDEDARFDEAYFEGVDAIFVRPISEEELERGAAFSFVESFDNRDISRRHLRKRIRRARVTCEFGWQKITGYATNFSLGGMFIGSMDELPDRGQKISFKLSFVDEELQPVIGNAIVKWSRSRLSYGRPRGFGVEFTELTEEMERVLDRLLNNK